MVKRIVVICCLFVLIIGLGVGDLKYSKAYFDKMQAQLDTLNQSLQSSVVEKHQVTENYASLKNLWDDRKMYFLMMKNHLCINQLDSQICNIGGLIEFDKYQDACINIANATQLVKELSMQDDISLTNLL